MGVRPQRAYSATLEVTLADRVQDDLRAAMKSGEKVRVGALRMVLAALQADAKEGKGDEQAVLRRERKRRLESARAFRDAGREELVGPEEQEAELIATYLPAEIGDDELEAAVRAAIDETGATSPKEMGAVMKAAMARTGGQADGRRVSAKAKELLT